MAKKFLSFLGTGKYEPCYYGDCEFQTRFIQEAIIRKYCKDWTKEDKTIIFLTDKAKSYNWFNETDKDRRLKERLYDLNITVEYVDIPSGQNVDEIWDIFDIVFNSIDDGDEIIYDVTHSFRSIPMLALVIFNYAKVMKNIKLIGIYYGAYEAKEGNKAPIFDLTSFDELLDWAQAVNTFLRYGNSQHIKETASSVLKYKLSNKDKQAIQVREFTDKLYDFTNAIYTCRGKYDEDIKKARNISKRSVCSAYSGMNWSLQNLIKDSNKSVKPLVPLFQKIEERTKDFSDKDNLKNGVAFIKWSIDNNLTQQAYTALDETMKTYICVKNGLDETDYDIREYIVTRALRIRTRMNSGKCLNEYEWDVKEKYKDQVRDIVNGIDRDFAKLAGEVSKYRNDINHFGFNKEALDYETLNRKIREYYKTFETYVQELYKQDK